MSNNKEHSKKPTTTQPMKQETVVDSDNDINDGDKSKKDENDNHFKPQQVENITIDPKISNNKYLNWSWKEMDEFLAKMQEEGLECDEDLELILVLLESLKQQISLSKAFPDGDVPSCSLKPHSHAAYLNALLEPFKWFRELKEICPPLNYLNYKRYYRKQQIQTS